MTTTTENTTFEERLQARLIQMGDSPKRVYTEEQKERNRERYREMYKNRTEEQIEADRKRARDRYHDKSPIGSRVRVKREVVEANGRIAEMVKDSNSDYITEVYQKENNEPLKVQHTLKTEAERKARNEQSRIRYANRTEEEKEKQRDYDRRIYHQIGE